MEEPIRIARVIARLNVGGPAQHVAALAARMPGRFRTRLYAGAVGGAEQEMTSVLDDPRIDLVRVPNLGAALRAGDDLGALVALARELESFRPHIIHTHTAKAGLLGRVIAVACGIPLRVHTFHGHVFNGYFSPAASRALLLVERSLARATTAVVTLSERQRQDIVERYAVAPAAKVHVIPLGFDFGRFDRAEESGKLRREIGVGADEPIVACVGRLTAVKDVGLLLKAFALVKRDATLVLVGGGEDEPSLRAAADALGISRRVRFLGFRDDVPELLADVDVVALTSRNEGTPVALIEALAAGCHPVATDVGGVGDVLVGGRLGTLVGERSPTAFAAALEAALVEARGPQVAARRTERRAHARASFGVERLVGNHASLYEALIRTRLPCAWRGRHGSLPRFMRARCL